MNKPATAINSDEQKIKQDWKKTKAALRNCNADGKIPDPKRKTALEKLIARYRSFVYLECLCLILFPSCMHWLFNDPNDTLLAMYAIIFFITAVVVDYKLAQKLATIDIQQMTVAAVLRTILECRKRHLQSMILLIPMAVGFIGVIAYASINETHLLIGIVVGLVAGLALGIREFRGFLRDYRTAVADTEIHD